MRWELLVAGWRFWAKAERRTKSQQLRSWTRGIKPGQETGMLSSSRGLYAIYFITCLLPLCQDESLYKTILTKICFICTLYFHFHANHSPSIWNVLLKASFWNRGNGNLEITYCNSYLKVLKAVPSWRTSRWVRFSKLREGTRESTGLHSTINGCTVPTDPPSSRKHNYVNDIVFLTNISVTVNCAL